MSLGRGSGPGTGRWPVRRGVHDVARAEQKEMLRETPTNNWSNSTGELVPHERPMRMLSLANEAHRMAKPPKWVGSPEKTHMTWSQVRAKVGASKDLPKS